MPDQFPDRATCGLPKIFPGLNEVRRSAKPDAAPACFPVGWPESSVGRVMPVAKIAGRMLQHQRRLAGTVSDGADFDPQSGHGKPSACGKDLGTEGVRKFFNIRLVPTACAEALAAVTNVAAKGEPA